MYIVQIASECVQDDFEKKFDNKKALRERLMLRQDDKPIVA